MFTTSDYKKLQQIMDESDHHRALLEKLLASHEEMLHTLRHELNNSLTMLSGSVQYIEAAHPEVKSFKYWGTLQSDIEDLTRLLNDLSRTHHQTVLRKELLDTASFLRTLALAFAASIAHTNVEFMSCIPEHLPDISADAMKLKEVLLNLLKNALEALDDESNVCAVHDSNAPSPARITLHASSDDRQLKIQVSDTGCGISKEQEAHIFTPFVTYKTGGTGLGLSIAKEIIEAHHGTLEVSSIPEAGTTFTILLPLR